MAATVLLTAATLTFMAATPQSHPRHLLPRCRSRRSHLSSASKCATNTTTMSSRPPRRYLRRWIKRRGELNSCEMRVVRDVWKEIREAVCA
eukprot:1147891-Rhodomonas_salina.1